MDFFSSLIKRQQGTCMKQDYDYALSRLKCNKSDVYRGFAQSAEEEASLGADTPIFASKFCPKKGHEKLLALANEDGYIAIQSTDKSKQFVSNHGHFNAIFDLAWMPNDLFIITAAGDHSVILWDVHESGIREVSRFDCHTRSVKTAVFRHEDNAVFATGARDGAVMVWDIRANHPDTPDNIIGNAHGSAYPRSKTRKYCPASRVQSITGLAFQDDFTLLSCAAGDGVIKAWDLRKNYTVHKKDPVAKHCLQHVGRSTRNGFTSLLMCPSQVTLYASCMNNIIYAYNIGTYNPKPFAEYYGHENNTYYVKSCLSPDGKYIASGSSDEAAYIWKTSEPGNPIVRLNGHRAEVATVAWSYEYETKLVTCSDDATHRIWKVGEVNDYEEDRNDIRGYAAWIENRECKNKKDMSEVQLQTPTTDFSMSADESTPMSAISSTSNNPGSANSTASNKRTYEQMNTNVLSPIHENREYKRPHLENRGARRLFSPTNRDEASCSKNYELDDPSFRSPTKVGSQNKTSLVFSPTVNLPNFVIDGTAPHLLEMSPRKCQNENVDWLTKMRKQRQEQNADKIEGTKSLIANRRRSTSSEPRSPATSLLNYFKIQMKEGSKSPQPSTSKDKSENC